MTFLFSILTLALLLAATLFAQTTGMVVTNYFMLFAALLLYIVWQSRTSMKVEPAKRGRSAA